jgi:hypothetical protein
MQELLLYGIIVCYAGATKVWGAFVLSGIGLIMLITSNVIFYVIYKKEIIND